ncbi:MAG: hypothetical protein WCY37_03585 [Candidatus Dojkabacteria bacterium]
MVPAIVFSIIFISVFVAMAIFMARDGEIVFSVLSAVFGLVFGISMLACCMYEVTKSNIIDKALERTYNNNLIEVMEYNEYGARIIIDNEVKDVRIIVDEQEAEEEQVIKYLNKQ